MSPPPTCLWHSSWCNPQCPREHCWLPFWREPPLSTHGHIFSAPMDLCMSRLFKCSLTQSSFSKSSLPYSKFPQWFQQLGTPEGKTNKVLTSVFSYSLSKGLFSYNNGGTIFSLGFISLLIYWSFLLPFLSFIRFNSRWILTFLIQVLHIWTLSLYFPCLYFMYSEMLHIIIWNIKEWW